MRQIVLFAASAFALAAPAAAAPVVLGASLTGANETKGGDTDGSGALTAEIDADVGDLCYTLTAGKIDRVTMAHIHSGAAGADGPPVVTIQVARDLCMAVEPDVLKPILADPASYYVNIHTAAFPSGAVRGQLAKK